MSIGPAKVTTNGAAVVFFAMLLRQGQVEASEQRTEPDAVTAQPTPPPASTSPDGPSPRAGEAGTPPPSARPARATAHPARSSLGQTDEDDPYWRLKRTRTPIWGMMVELGAGGGGDDLVTVTLSDGSRQTLSAGDGVAVSVGLMVTPLWLGDRLGAGVTATAGYKGMSVGGSNGGIGLGRFPVTAAIHVLPRFAQRWFFLIRGGIDQETNVSLSGSGIASGVEHGLRATLGAFGEAGVYNILDTPEQRGASSLTLRYTKLTYTAEGGSADGSSVMLFCAIYYNP